MQKLPSNWDISLANKLPAVDSKNIYLNHDQQVASSKFFEFLFDDTAKEYHISGPAGSGKSFLMAVLLDEVIPHYIDMCRTLGIPQLYKDVILTATTNKAVDVLVKQSGRYVETVYSAFNFYVSNNYETGISELKRKNAWQILENKIIWIDEASMVDQVLYNAIKESTLNCKIVWVGDMYQINPVKDVISPVYGHKPQYLSELTIPMRNRNQPALQALCSQVRDMVKTGTFTNIKTVPGVIDHLTSKEMKAEIDKAFLVPTQDMRILAYTNKSVIAFNHYIRHKLRKLPREIQPGEFLMNASLFKTTNKGNIPVDSIVEVIENHGTSHAIIVHKDNNVENSEHVTLEVETLTVRDQLGYIIHGLRVPVDKVHYKDLMNYYANQEKWDIHYNLKEKFADLRNSDATTVHKAQGSTFDTVYVDLDSFNKCTKSYEASRLLYVAASRAKERVVFYGELKEAYGGTPTSN